DELTKLDGPEPDGIDEAPVIDASAGAISSKKAILAADAEIVDDASQSTTDASKAHTGPAPATSGPKPQATGTAEHQGDKAAGSSPGPSESREPAKATDGSVEGKASAEPTSKPADHPDQQTAPAGPDRTRVP